MNLQNYLSLITDMGLKEKEAAIYLTCLKLGQEVVSKISITSGVPRTLAYEVLGQLSEKGLVSSVEIRGKIHYSALSLDQFKLMQQNKVNRFSAALPEMLAMVKTVGDRPRVRFLEGNEGIITALNETLELSEGSEFLAYASGEGFYEDEPEIATDYIKRRVKRKISVRSLATNTPTTKVFSEKNVEQLRETRLVPVELYPFPNEINVFGNKVSIMNMQGERLAVIIESESIVKMQRSLFELAWLGAERFN